MAKKLYGTDPDQVPTNADLGSAAYADTQNMPETRLTNQPLSAKFGAEGDVPTDLASTLDFMQISGSTFIQTSSDAQAFIKTNNYWNGSGTSYVDTTRGSTTIRLNENNAGIFQVETAPSGGTATSNRFRIDEDGHVTMPAQAAFSVTRNSTAGNLAVNTLHTLSWATEIFDQNSNFSNTTFTAPVTGKYHLSTLMRLQQVDSAAAYIDLRFVTTNRSYQWLFAPDDDLAQDADFLPASASVLADMDAGDTAYMTIYISGGASQMDIQQGSHFFGYLVA
jgi:hypothetical protein